MLLFLIEGASQKCVQVIFDKLTEKLDTEIFQRLISIILTGNGGEFNASDSHGNSDYDVRCTNNFYISLWYSCQILHIERNHKFILQVIAFFMAFYVATFRFFAYDLQQTQFYLTKRISFVIIK